MIELKITIPGLDKLREALKKAPEKTLEEISIAVRKSALQFKSQALKESPVNKQPGGGNLRQNIRERFVSRTRAEVTSFAPYSGYVEYGTRPHEIRPINKKGLANKRSGQYFGKLVHHPGTSANPFMARALNATRSIIKENFKTAIKNVFDSLKK